MSYSSSIGKKRSSLMEQIRIRLLFCVGLLLLVLIIRIVASEYTIVSTNTVYGQNMALRDESNGLITAMIDQETGLRGYLATSNQTFLQPFYSGHQIYTSKLADLKELLRISNFTKTRAALPFVEKSADNWYQNYALIQLVGTHKQHAVNAQMGKLLFDRFRIQANRLLDASQQDVSQQQNWAGTINTVVTVIAVLLSILVIGVVWQTFTRFAMLVQTQLRTLEEKTTQLGNGGLDVRVPELRSEELHQLGCTFNRMAGAMQRQSEALREHDVLENVLQLNMVLTSTLDLPTLTVTFLEKALSLLQLQIIAIYLYDSEKGQLCLKGAQGCDYRELTQEFALGEGLVGSTAKNRTISYIQQPKWEKAREFSIKTILGNVLPTSLYQLPLIQGNELLGVLAVGSLYPISEKVRNTLNVVSSNFAAVISHIKAYEHIQIQAEILASKSHEQEQTNVALRIQRDELRTLNIALEEANQVRNRFLTTMTHELRTPLTAILGFSQILLRAMENEDVRRRGTIERILKNGHHMLDLINDALNLVKIEAGQMSVSISPISLPAVIQSVTEETQAFATTKMLQLEVEIEPNIPEIASDIDKLRQILLNLISNAIKFTERGEICIRAKKLSLGDRGGEYIAISVQDSGIGIAQEMQERIFEAFYQGDNSITRRYGGTGLGLSIVSHLINLLGGTLTLESSLGQGSIFTLILPPQIKGNEEPFYAEAPEIKRREMAHISAV